MPFFSFNSRKHPQLCSIFGKRSPFVISTVARLSPHQTHLHVAELVHWQHHATKYCIFGTPVLCKDSSGPNIVKCYEENKVIFTCHFTFLTSLKFIRRLSPYVTHVKKVISTIKHWLIRRAFPSRCLQHLACQLIMVIKSTACFTRHMH